MSQPVSVGIVSAGMYLPEGRVTAAEIAVESGMPEWVVRDKLGIISKTKARPDEHPNQMAVWAALDCLSKTDIKADPCEGEGGKPGKRGFWARVFGGGE